MRYGSLFSGIGGIDLGLDRAGFECSYQVEINDYCRKVLNKHWPEVPKYKDVTEVDFEKLRESRPVELLAGGFPCQDLSYAGKGLGLSGPKSGLWSEYKRAIRLVRPQYVLVENVPGLLGRGMGVVLGDLASLGYDAEWQSFPASAFGAPHLRWRIFIVAYATQLQCNGGEHNGGCHKQSRQEIPQSGNRSSQNFVEYAYGKRQQEQRESVSLFPQQFDAERAGGWESEPDICRVANGVPRRVDRLRGLGNAVVPRAAEYLGLLIKEHANE